MSAKLSQSFIDKKKKMSFDSSFIFNVEDTISDDDDTNVQIIRDSLRQEYPEIDTLLYSNRYIKLIMNVPGRSLRKCHEKIRNSLQWRHSYNVNKLRNAFIYTTTTYQQQQQHQRVFEEDDDFDTDDGIFIPLDQQNQNQNQTDNTNSSNYYYNSSSFSSPFIPTSELIEVCASGAFVIKRNKTIEVVMIDDDVDDIDINSKDDDEDDDHHADNDHDNDKNEQKQKRGNRKETMLILYADTSRLNWWKTVLEQALEQIRRSNHKSKNYDNNNIHKEEEEEDREVLSESIIVCVDTTNRRRRRRRNNGCNIRGSRNGRGRGRERRNTWSRMNSSASFYLPMPIPPPLSAIRGMVELMQKGYPTRIYRIYIGPIHPWLQREWGCIELINIPGVTNPVDDLTKHLGWVLHSPQGILNGVPITVFNDRGGFPEDSDCMDQDTFLAFLNTKDVDIGYFSMDGPRPGTWSCQEVCPTAAIENENNTGVVSTVENENNTDVVSTSQVSDTPTASAARARASTIGCLFLFVVLNSLLTYL
ncbi:hypothetical protein FRACYDRAFT_233773 [Fragilariopsis cylindrus CCMP1102]|uniref:Uncharacterized protein n=1 Tax=Fragilariopsis cylindrus CCMP1102 TaxID=635003 RepID=A0A1E7FZL5_9STRA|nr:hypothetical protein FRACYDRAFT_233773 [Fragilariopsis cylindrus CCMP1102]|eukprot:OEU23601.1 hypothetical protein FRACYDRAFT_233773 [Fragilariopsis cylindrus CCMP1102]